MSTKTSLSSSTSTSLNETDYEPREELAGLSAEQLKAKLLQTVKSKGILDSIKVCVLNSFHMALAHFILKIFFSSRIFGTSSCSNWIQTFIIQKTTKAIQDWQGTWRWTRSIRSSSIISKATSTTIHCPYLCLSVVFMRMKYVSAVGLSLKFE